MQMQRLLEQLIDASAYPHTVERVVVHQTHISIVFLAGAFAYKVKKPVNLDFLNFSTLALRRHYCEEEVRLNRRLAPHVYLGVVPITQEGGRLRVEGSGEPLEWAVKMVRLPVDGSLLSRLERGDVSTADMIRLARFLAEFHRTASTNEQIAAFGRFDVVAANARENFSQAIPQIGLTLSRNVFERLCTLTEAALTRLRPLIESRARRGVSRDTHGDLHLDHVFLNMDHPIAIDCIEFNERFRYADPVADLAFLIMDLKFRGRPDLATELSNGYFRETNDDEGRLVLDFYVSYRAAVRGKVEGFEAFESEVPAEKKQAAIEQAKAHWLLALAQLEVPGQRPALVMVGGLPGTGKSTMCRELAAAAGFDVIRSDLVRKELAGVAPLTRLGNEWYSQEWNDRTYQECLRRAESLVFEGRRVIIDATFRDDQHRIAVLTLARSRCVPVVLLVCEANPEAVRNRLASRSGDASDADIRAYHHAAENWEPASTAVASILVTVHTDTTNDALHDALRILSERGISSSPD